MNKRGDHPFIQREQTYALDRKLLSVHSEDRDINKWPNASHFELQLPQTYVNVETISVVECSFPIYYNTFSNENQNTKLTFKVVANGITITTAITISPGCYGPIQLATELQNRLNLAVNSTYTNFKVFYDEVRQRLLFGNVKDPFTFIYNAPENYDREPCNSASSQSQPQPVRWNQFTKWGLAYNLGFVKGLNASNTSIAAPVGSSQSVYYTNLSESAAGHMWLPVATGVTGYILVPPNPPSLNGDSVIYLEIDKCNYQDEMQPYTENNGIVNAAFAKFMIQSKPPPQILDSCQYQYSYEPPDTSQGMVSYFPPLDKLSKLKFKFRYHDGTLVDFGGLNFNFTIGLFCLRDEIARSKQMRTPYMQ
jgi:hypothetical protein